MRDTLAISAVSLANAARVMHFPGARFLASKEVADVILPSIAAGCKSEQRIQTLVY